MKRKLIIGLLVLALLAGGYWYYRSHKTTPAPAVAQKESGEKTKKHPDPKDRKESKQKGPADGSLKSKFKPAAALKNPSLSQAMNPTIGDGAALREDMRYTITFYSDNPDLTRDAVKKLLAEKGIAAQLGGVNAATEIGMPRDKYLDFIKSLKGVSPYRVASQRMNTRSPSSTPIPMVLKFQKGQPPNSGKRPPMAPKGMGLMKKPAPKTPLTPN